MPAPQQQSITALITDDDLKILDTISTFLEHKGIQNTTVCDVDSAIEELNRSNFDIVISDVDMPNKNGVTLFNYVRSHFETIPFIFVTGQPNLQLAVDSMRDGCYDYITKPIDLTLLHHKVRDAIGKSQRRLLERQKVDYLKDLLQKRLFELRIYKDVIDSTNDGLLLLNTDGIIVDHNLGFEMISGLNRNAIENNRFSTVTNEIFPGLNIQEIQEHVAVDGQWQGEVHGYRIDGASCWSNLSYFSIKDDQDQTFAYALLVKDVTEQRELQKNLIQSLEKTNAAHEAIIYGLAQLAEQRDGQTGDHLERIRRYCKTLAKAMASHQQWQKTVTEPFISMLYRVAPLHDIGKVGIPDRILCKKGKLTATEFNIMKEHTTIGFQTLQAIREKYGEMEFLDMGIDITYCHHECYDGSGYPRGIKQDEIPLSAQILSVADVYDALTSIRHYKNAYNHDDALDEMIKERGTRFCPDVFDVFLSVADRFGHQIS